MDSPDSLVIETHNLSKAYKEVQALKHLNLAVKQHSIFGFLGPNGAGKTTTIKLLLGLPAVQRASSELTSNARAFPSAGGLVIWPRSRATTST